MPEAAYLALKKKKKKAPYVNSPRHQWCNSVSDYPHLGPSGTLFHTALGPSFQLSLQLLQSQDLDVSVPCPQLMVAQSPGLA